MTNTNHTPLSERQALCAARVTLDGRPAKVTGYRLPFAQVRAGSLAVEFAWPTVALIVARGGAFKS